VNKQKFVRILNNKKSIGQDDLKKIELLEKDYPYSQVLHTLSALVSYSRKEKNSKQKLNTAAVYSTDRSVLKDLVLSIDVPVTVAKPASAPSTTQARTTSKSTQTESGTKGTTSTRSKSQRPVVKTAKHTIIDQPTNRPGNLTSKEAEELRQEVMKNLENLMIVKSEFMKIIDSDSKVKKAVKKKSKKVSKKKIEKEEKSLLKAKKEKTSTKKGSALKVNAKAESTPKKSKKEQNQIIERFIKVDPKIKKGQSKESESQNDLSVQSVKFGKDLVSENLAKIMIKQGKKSKAVDIYKKLIWKYPQKKAYFASQIESIKEK
jgi:hypothetical protein